MKNLFSISFILGLLLSASGTIASQETVHYPPMAAYGMDGNLRLYGFDDEPLQLTLEDDGLGKVMWHPGGPLHDITWSNDGKYLAFVGVNNHLMLFDTQKRELKDLEIYPSEKFHITFDRDSQYLLYGSWGKMIYDAGYEKFYELNISRISLTTDSAPLVLATVGSVSSLYGGAPISPANTIYRNEMKGYWRSGDRILVDTPFGLLSPNGFGLHPDQEFQDVPIGIHLYQLGGTVKLGTSPINNAAISPELNRIATIHDSGIEIIDLETEESHFYLTKSPPDIVAWNGNNSLFYTSIDRLRDLQDTITLEEKDALFAFASDIFSDSLTSNTAHIYELNLLDSTEHDIYASDVYAVGQLEVTPDGKTLFFTTVPNLDIWFEMIVSEATGNNSSSHMSMFDLFQPSFYKLDLENGNLELISTGLFKPTVNIPVYMEQLENK